MKKELRPEEITSFCNNKRNKNGIIILTESAWQKIPSIFRRWVKGHCQAQVIVNGKFEDIVFDRSRELDLPEMNYQTDW